jgi:hypothetical protein
MDSSPESAAARGGISPLPAWSSFADGRWPSSQRDRVIRCPLLRSGVQEVAAVVAAGDLQLLSGLHCRRRRDGRPACDGIQSWVRGRVFWAKLQERATHLRSRRLPQASMSPLESDPADGMHRECLGRSEPALTNSERWAGCMHPRQMRNGRLYAAGCGSEIGRGSGGGGEGSVVVVVAAPPRRPRFSFARVTRNATGRRLRRPGLTTRCRARRTTFDVPRQPC